VKRINVIDLDKTLLPYDSFRLLIKRVVFNLNIYIICITFIRVFRIISAEHYKNKTIKYLKKKYTDKYFEQFANEVVKDIDTEVQNLIGQETNEDTINILLSASPDLFVKHIADALEWEGKGSYFDKKGNFIHLYGKNKISWVKNNYDVTKYYYNFAISDSNSDDNLLMLFKRSTKWISH